MASNISDRWLWLGVGVLLFTAAKGIQYAITEIVNLTELDADQYPNENDTQSQPEDSIPLSTLRTLLHSPNESISTTAKQLILNRFLALPNAAELIAKDSKSHNPHLSERAKQAIDYLYSAHLDFEIDLQNTQFPIPSSSRHGGNRTLGLDTLLALDDEVADDDVDPAELIEQFQRGARNIVERLEEMDEDEEEMTAEQISANQRIEEEYRRRFRELERRHEVEREALIEGEGSTSTSSARFAGWDEIPHQRPSPAGGNEDEAERRRRRREAMVLHEGSGRVEEEDIIRPRGR